LTENQVTVHVTIPNQLRQQTRYAAVKASAAAIDLDLKTTPERRLSGSATKQRRGGKIS
jgi:hypothetical protein